MKQDSISTTTISDVKASIYKAIAVTFVIRKSDVFATEAAYNYWGGRDR